MARMTTFIASARDLENFKFGRLVGLTATAGCAEIWSEIENEESSAPTDKIFHGDAVGEVGIEHLQGLYHTEVGARHETVVKVRLKGLCVGHTLPVPVEGHIVEIVVLKEEGVFLHVAIKSVVADETHNEKLGQLAP